jgi:hypothetical protein
MNKEIFIAVAFLAVSGSAFPEEVPPHQEGKITICRMHGITELMDGKRVEIPADTYTGACDRNGEHCRNIRLKGEKATLGPSKSSCVTVNAEMLETDGKPIKKGEHLLEQWSVPGFTPSIRAATDFKYTGSLIEKSAAPVAH